MGSVQIYLDDEEDEKVDAYSKKWECAKYKTIQRMIREFKETNIDNNPSERRAI